VKHLYGDVQMKWIDEYFPFTDPSLEVEIFFNDDWVEVLGSGVILDGVMQNAGRDTEKEVGWAFGLGLERWAMKLFDIGDIRLFWTEDERFLKQFKDGEITTFKPYSKYPSCYKDMTFWIPDDFNENNFMQVVRAVASDLAETVELIDEFTHPKHKRTSMCWRINYRHMDRNLTNEEVDTIQFKLRDEV
jgi:phenylalanyl-tRNA synthetase alpha chain